MSGNSIAHKRIISPNDRSKEIDLRKELDDLLYGSSVEISKHYEVLIRKFRRDSKNFKIKCSCNAQNEGSINPQCTRCLGEGYYWDEKIVPSFKQEGGRASETMKSIAEAKPGETRSKVAIFYLPADVIVNTTDLLIELVKEETRGTNYKNLKRGKEWKIQEVEEKRSDYGRLEYLVVYCTTNDHLSSRRAEL